MGLLDMLGGRPGDTERLKMQYDMHAQRQMENGEPPMQWQAWLQTQGYQLGPDNLVVPLNLRAQDSPLRKVNY